MFRCRAKFQLTFGRGVPKGYNSFDEGSLGWITRLVGFTRRILHSPSGIRVIGVCFGHQIIARALGVMPQRNNNGWEVAVSNVDLTDAGKDVFRLDNLVSTTFVTLRLACPYATYGQADVRASVLCRGYIKCIAILCRTLHPGQSRWVAHHIPKCKGCMRRDVFSACKGIRSTAVE